MIGYALLVLITFFVVVVGFIVCGVAVWGWRQEKKAMLAKKAQVLEGQNPADIQSVAQTQS